MKKIKKNAINLALIFSFIFPINSYADTVNQDIIFLKKTSQNKSYENLSDNVGKVLEQVKKIRNLPTKKPVSVGIKTIDELNIFLKNTFEKEYPDKELRKDTLMLQRLGLLEKGIDLKKTFLDLYTQQIAGLYDNEAKELYVIDNPKIGELESSIVISHELTHALQDQNFDITKFVGKDKNNSDAMMAKTAVIEGEATVASMQYVIKNTASQGLKGFSGLLKNPLGASLASMDSLKKVPGFLIEQMMFPYVKGQSFVSYIYENMNNNWDDFNSVYKRPPESTEQIMHPEKYLAKESPVKVNINEKTINNKNWTLINKDTFGEFFLFNYFLEYLDEEESTKASEGWGGDYSALYVKNNSDDTILVYKSVWDTEQDAKEFFESYINTLKVRYEKGLKVLKKSDTIYKADSPQGKIYIYLNGKSVNLVEGYSSDMEKNIITMLN